MRSALVPRSSIFRSPSEKYFASWAFPFDSQKCVIESPMKTTFAPPLVTTAIFSLWRFICQQFGSPFQAVGVTARIAPKDAAQARVVTDKKISFFIVIVPFFFTVPEASSPRGVVTADRLASATTRDASGTVKRAFPFFESEITPKHDATGIEANFDWAAADAATKVRAVVEGQIANMYERTRWIGDFEEIKVTGGASRSKGIRGVIADIFKAKVTVLDVADSAAVGGARLAARALA